MSNKVGVTKQIISLLLVAASSTIAVAGEWSAPPPMGPYGGHFDFGIEPKTEMLVEPEYAMYRPENELPIVPASYSPRRAATQNFERNFSRDELESIDSAWSFNRETVSNYSSNNSDVDIWALGEIAPAKVSHLIDQPIESIETVKIEPCRVSEEDMVVDGFESAMINMDALGREADLISNAVSTDQAPMDSAPRYFSSFMPERALGLRQADAMDPLALIPQMSNPVRYFGFQ